MDGRLIIDYKWTAIDLFDAREVTHNIVFIESAFTIGFDELLVLILKESPAIQDLSKDIVIHVAAAPKRSTIIAAAIVRIASVMASFAKFAEKCENESS